MIKKIPVVVILVLLFAFPCRAYEMPKLEDYIPEDSLQELPADCIDFSGEYPVINYKAIISKILNSLTGIIRPIINNLLSLISTVVICATFKTLNDSAENDTLKRVFSYISLCIIALIMYNVLVGIWDGFTLLCEKIYSFMNTITPSITLLYALSGNVVSATVSQSMTSIILTVFSDIFYHGIKPVLQICFGFCIASLLTGSVNLKPISSFVRKAYTTVLIAVITLMTAVMSFQSVLNSSADSLAAKTVKFISATGIPLVGGALGEAVAGVGAGVGVIRSGFGILSVIALLIMILPVLISMWLNKISLSFADALCRIFSLDLEGELISACSELINFAIAVCVAVSVMFISNLTLFSRCASAIGG